MSSTHYSSLIILANRTRRHVNFAARLSALMLESIISATKSELMYLQASERAAYLTKDHNRVRKSLKEIDFVCKSYQRKEKKIELQLRERYRLKEASSDRLAAADTWFFRANMEEIRCRKILTKVTTQTKYMDTTVMQGVSQRFDTRKLYHDLHWLYFHKLAETMAVRAEIISNESRLMELSEILNASVHVGVFALGFFACMNRTTHLTSSPFLTTPAGNPYEEAKAS